MLHLPTASVAFPSNLTKHGRLAMSYVDIKTFSDVGRLNRHYQA